MKKYLITFGDDDLFKYQKKRIKQQAESTKWFDDIIIESPDTIRDFTQIHKDFIDNNPKGYGYWIWKPYIILRQLHKIEENDLLFYIDAGSSIIRNKKDKFEKYCDYLENSQTPIITFFVDWYKERHYQKMDLLKRLSLDNSIDFLDSFHSEANIFMCRKCDFTMNFVQQWLDLMLENNYILSTDSTEYNKQIEDFIGHRHDQSILSALCKINNIPTFLSEAYGLGCFFTSRMSDKNLKKLSPDLFRLEEDGYLAEYNTWESYLIDPQIKSRAITSIKNQLENLRKTLIFDGETELKDQFLPEILKFLEKIQYDKGIHSITLLLDEPYPFTYSSRNVLIGEIQISMTTKDKSNIPFKITSDTVNFPEVKPRLKEKYCSVKYEKTRHRIIS